MIASEWVAALPGLVEQCVTHVEPRKQRGARDVARHAGAVYTPPPLVQFVTRCAMQTLVPDSTAARRASIPLRILDPSCGDGRFLRESLRYAEAAGWSSPTVFGFERDVVAAEVARNSLPAAHISCVEALLGSPDVAPVDLVVGNPPYVRSIRMKRSNPSLWQALRGSYAATSIGEWDLYGAFIEKSMHWLRPEGIAALIVPSRWFTAAFAAKLRAAVGGQLQTIIDFGAVQLFEDATTYCSIVILRKGAQHGVNQANAWERDRRENQRRLESEAQHGANQANAWERDRRENQRRLESEAQHGANQANAWERDRRENQRRLESEAHPMSVPVSYVHRAEQGWQLTQVPRVAVVTSKPWVLREQELFGLSETTLGQVARIAKGAGTSADKVFLMRRVHGAPGAAIWQMQNGYRELVEIESAALVAAMRGRDIGRDNEPSYCLLPYAAGALIPWPQLQQQWPLTAAYFVRCRGELAARENRRFDGDGFYAFGRPQNVAFHLSGESKVAIPDITRGGRAQIDNGTLLLDSAYAVRARSSDSAFAHPAMLHAILSSPAIPLWLTQRGVVLRGGYLRMKTTVLSVLPLPEDEELVGAADHCARNGQLAASHEFLRRAWRIDETRWRQWTRT